MRNLRSAAALAAVLCFAAGPAGADGPATSCEGRLLAIMLKSMGGQWVTVWKGDDPIDLFNSRAPCILLQNKGNIPPGNYSNIKLRISETFRLSGNDGPYRTKEGGAAVLGGTAPTMERLPGEILSYEETRPSWTSKDEEGTITFKVDYDYKDKDDYIEIYRRREFQDPIVITPKTLIKISININLGTSFQFAVPGSLALNIPEKKALVFLLPKSITEMSLRVDTRSRYIRGAESVVEF